MNIKERSSRNFTLPQVFDYWRSSFCNWQWYWRKETVSGLVTPCLHGAFSCGLEKESWKRKPKDLQAWFGLLFFQVGITNTMQSANLLQIKKNQSICLFLANIFVFSSNKKSYIMQRKKLVGRGMISSLEKENEHMENFECLWHHLDLKSILPNLSFWIDHSFFL